ncbi:hypothetical protein COR50_17705 [Chitinophaga caeni]|uniref:DUF2892 domain-containing protein n=1 Tax=Chitinophaga caeni TaxID=2029983 RepID=A0A291QY59_9BACT|nr:hypothetical protein [Chitinophaga caeni]ATL48851.1 hypothetical protein COR50_17705 [Chitinophaga caeni]
MECNIKNWTLMKWIRLVLGAALLIEGLRAHDVWIGVMGGFLLVMTLANVGCCSMGACSTPRRNTSGKRNENIDYEELK